MMCSAVLQTQISAIMDVLAKAAVAEIGQLLEEDAAALHHEIRRREEEIRGLKTRLQMTERKLQRAAADRRSIGLQVEMWDACVSADSQEDIYVQEENIATSPVKELSEVKPWLSHAPEMIRPVKPSTDPPRAHQLSRDEEFSGLEFEMKIEQVEEFVDQKLNQAQEEQRSVDGNSDLWLSGEPDKAFDDSENRSDSEQRSQNFTDHVAQVLMEDPMSSQSAHSLFGAGVVLDNENYNGVTPENKDVEYGFQKDPLNLLTATQQDSHRQTPTHSGTSLTDSTVFSRVQCLYSSSAVPKTLTTSHTQSLYVGDPQQHSAGSKTFRCEECGKDFTQRTRLRTHRLVHTGEKPFRCQLCGKTFSRQDNCLRHLRLHSGQHSQLDRYLP